MPEYKNVATVERHTWQVLADALAMMSGAALWFLVFWTARGVSGVHASIAAVACALCLWRVIAFLLLALLSRELAYPVAVHIKARRVEP